MAIGKVMHVGCLLAFKLWGVITITDSVGTTVLLPVSYQNTDYKIFTTHYNGVLPSSVVPTSVGNITLNSFYVSNNTNNNPAIFWATIG